MKNRALATLAGIFAMTAALMLNPSPGLAETQGLEGTLKKIAADGVVVIGYRESSIPFSYYDDAKKPIGFSMDLSDLILDNIKKAVGKPDLHIRRLPITSQNRISLLQNGTIDFECTTTTHNTSREGQVDFSNTFFVIGTRLLTRKASGIQDFADLKSQNVVVGAGTTSEILLRKMNVEKSMSMNVISAKDHAESFLMLHSGRAKAMMMDDALLAGERAKASDSADFVITGTAQSREAYGCMVRKGDAQLKALLDTTIAEVQTSSKAVAIYDKWFRSQIPPKGLNLDFAMSDDMKALFAKPNDKVLE